MYKGIKIKSGTYIRLLKFRASLTARNGKARTFDDAINELLNYSSKGEAVG